MPDYFLESGDQPKWNISPVFGLLNANRRPEESVAPVVFSLKLLREYLV